MKLKDLTNKIFGRLTVINRGENIENKAAWVCKCSCGSIIHLRSWSLVSGNTISCGCYGNETRGKASITHGMRRSREYKTWQKMKERCYNRNSINYRDYGGRGITVCDKWRNEFSAFLSDMRLKPTPKHSIERINNNGNYEPTNCRWANRYEQAANKSNSIKIEFNGETKIVAEWARIHNFKPSTFSSQLRRTNKTPLQLLEHYANKNKKTTTI